MNEDWSEDDSELYRRLVDAAVPRRSEQIAALLTLLPLEPGGTSRVVELGCGPGTLTHAILEAYPRCQLTALDGSESMIRHAGEALRGFAGRFRLDRFELSHPDWLSVVQGADAVVSSLCLHHLDGAQKKQLFREVHDRLSPAGGFLIVDLVAPVREEARELFRATWDRYASGSEESAWKLFQQERWNDYRYPDPADKPSRLVEQLVWLTEAGFSAVDCFWMDAGHAVFGGYRGRAREAASLSYADALGFAERAVVATR